MDPRHATVGLNKGLPGLPGFKPRKASPMEKSTIAKMALTAAVIVGGGGFLVYSSVGHAQHYRMVDELVGETQWDAKWTDKELKVHGYVESGSIVEAVVGQVQHRTFVLQKN